MAARHREFLIYLTEEIGLTPYRISVTIDRSNTYVQKTLEKPWAPNDETLDAYVEKLFLNRAWLRHGRGKMIKNLKALKEFADSQAYKARRKRRAD